MLKFSKFFFKASVFLFHKLINNFPKFVPSNKFELSSMEPVELLSPIMCSKFKDSLIWPPSHGICIREYFYVQQKTPYHHPPWYKNTNKISNPATWTKFKTTPKWKQFFLHLKKKSVLSIWPEVVRSLNNPIRDLRNWSIIFWIKKISAICMSFRKKTTIRLFNQLKVNNTANRSYLLRLYEQILKNNTFGKTRTTTTTICKVIKESALQFSSLTRERLNVYPVLQGIKAPVPSQMNSYQNCKFLVHTLEKVLEESWNSLLFLWPFWPALPPTMSSFWPKTNGTNSSTMKVSTKI